MCSEYLGRVSLEESSGMKIDERGGVEATCGDFTSVICGESSWRRGSRVSLSLHHIRQFLCHQLKSYTTREISCSFWIANFAAKKTTKRLSALVVDSNLSARNTFLETQSSSTCFLICLLKPFPNIIENFSFNILVSPDYNARY